MTDTNMTDTNDKQTTKRAPHIKRVIRISMGKDTQGTWRMHGQLIEFDAIAHEVLVNEFCEEFSHVLLTELFLDDKPSKYPRIEPKFDHPCATTRTVRTALAAMLKIEKAQNKIAEKIGSPETVGMAFLHAALGLKLDGVLIEGTFHETRTTAQSINLLIKDKLNLTD